MNAIIRPCTMAELEAAPNFTALIDEYADECAIEGMPRPYGKIELYKTLEAAGALTPFAAYLGGELIGFAGVVASPNPHYGVTIASTETLFVTKGSRRAGAGLRLIHACEECAKKLGAPGLLISAPVGSQLAELLTIMDSYTETNRVFFTGFNHA